MKSLMRIVLILLTLFSTTRAELILSEILANEPGRRVLTEWFEVFNGNSDSIDLSDYLFVIDGDTLTAPENSMVEVYGYAVLCRRLEPDDGGDCFEYCWGDSSGTWGDSPGENYPAYELGMNLVNGSGSIYLLDSTFTGLDDYSWSSAADDGRSIERNDVTAPFSGWHDCSAPEGSTPGKPNSELPSDRQNYFLEIIPQVARLSDINPVVTITYAAPSGTSISLYIYDDSALKRATLMEEGVSFGQYAWDLDDESGTRLTPGLYFILFRASGAINVNKSFPVVISP